MQNKTTVWIAAETEQLENGADHELSLLTAVTLNCHQTENVYSFESRNRLETVFTFKEPYFWSHQEVFPKA